MASSTSNMDQLTVNQAQKEVTVNAFIDAASIATAFARRASTTGGLTWGYFGGTVYVDGAAVVTSNSTLALTASTTNYVEVNYRTGVVTANTVGFTAGRWRLYTVVTNATTVTSYTDHRASIQPSFNGICTKSVAGGANVALTQVEASCTAIIFTGVLTGNITVFAPQAPWSYMIFNNTTGAFTLTFAPLSGSGIVVGSAKRAILLCDGTNVVRFTADL